MHRIKSLLVLLAVIISIEAIAIQMVHPIGLGVWLPDDWQRKIDGDKLSASSPDMKATVLYNVINASDVNTAIVKLDSELKSIMNDKKMQTKPTPIKQNGLVGIMANGSGSIKGVSSLWLAGIFIKDQSALMVLGFAEKQSFDLHKINILKMIKSIRAQ